MKEDDFDISQRRRAASAERVVGLAPEEDLHEYALLTNEHVCLAFAQADWDMLGEVMRDLRLNPHESLQALVTLPPTRVRNQEVREERMKKRFELPPFLKHFATKLNLPARLDKVPPVFGRNEVLCHRERAKSVLFLGEPGVGKTVIAEGLARRIEFEPDKVPVRLRDYQIVNLQMNTMVAGTLLRGMFEDRIQNVIREIKERPDLILFTDEAPTMIGADSALGAPSHAANVFKSVLPRGEVRIIRATTLSEYKVLVLEESALARGFRTAQVAEPTNELNKGPLKDGLDRFDGVLPFLDPTGAGKTELARSVGEPLFADEKRMIRVDMSEYQDGAVAVDKLIGMSRGIVGSKRGGVLTNQLKDTPCSVVLLAEVERATPSCSVKKVVGLGSPPTQLAVELLSE